MHATPNNPKPGKKSPSLKDTAVGKSDPTPPPGSIQAPKAKKKPTAPVAAKTPAKKAPSIPMAVKIAVAVMLAVFLLIVGAGCAGFAALNKYKAKSNANISKDGDQSTAAMADRGEFNLEEMRIEYHIKDSGNFNETNLHLTIKSQLNEKDFAIFFTDTTGKKEFLEIMKGTEGPHSLTTGKEIRRPGEYLLTVENKKTGRSSTHKIGVHRHHAFGRAIL